MQIPLFRIYSYKFHNPYWFHALLVHMRVYKWSIYAHMQYQAVGNMICMYKMSNVPLYSWRSVCIMCIPMYYYNYTSWILLCSVMYIMYGIYVYTRSVLYVTKDYRWSVVLTYMYVCTYKLSIYTLYILWILKIFFFIFNCNH